MPKARAHAQSRVEVEAHAQALVIASMEGPFQLLNSGVTFPSAAEVRAYGTETDPTRIISMRLQVIEGTVELVALGFSSALDQDTVRPITPTDVRDFNTGGWIKRAELAVAWTVKNTAPYEIQGQFVNPDRVAMGARRWRHAEDDATAMDVLAVMTHENNVRAPTKAVAETFGVSRRTASRMVADVKARGLIAGVDQDVQAVIDKKGRKK